MYERWEIEVKPDPFTSMIDPSRLVIELKFNEHDPFNDGYHLNAMEAMDLARQLDHAASEYLHLEAKEAPES